MTQLLGSNDSTVHIVKLHLMAFGAEGVEGRDTAVIACWILNLGAGRGRIRTRSDREN